MVVNVKQFQRYTNVFSDDTELQEVYLKSAQDIVESYLGYKIEENEDWNNNCNCNNPDLSGVDFIDGGDASNIKYDFFEELEQEEDNEEKNKNLNVPGLIIMTILRIAAILQMESDGNIAINSKSFSDSGTRTFINYTDYYKYLLPISIYKVLKI